jgi:hypothetical protein
MWVTVSLPCAMRGKDHRDRASFVTDHQIRPEEHVMRKFVLTIVAGTAVSLALPAVVPAKTVTLHATMKGSSEAPGPGDSDGSGSATIKLKAKKGKVCFTLNVKNIGPATQAHIHAGDPGQAGNVTVALVASETASKTITGCVDAAKSDIKTIGKHPKDYYVNVHTADFPAGAIRGQLHK